MESISIITTTNNSELYIFDCLKTVNDQDYRDFEHLIIDDGSTDDTLKHIFHFKEIYSNNKIVIIKSQKIGRARALNLGINNAKADVICIIDSDDIWDSSKLKIQYNLFKNYNLDLLCTRTTLFKKQNDISFINNSSSEISLDELGKIRLRDLLFKNSISHSSVMVKKSHCLYNVELNSQIDYELWIRLLYNNPVLDFRYCPLILNFHRIHENQKFESKGLTYKFKSFLLVNNYSIKCRYYDILIFNILKLPYYIFSRYAIVLISKLK